MIICFVMQGSIHVRINGEETDIMAGQVMTTLPESEGEFMNASSDCRFIMFVIFPDLLKKTFDDIYINYDRTVYEKGFLIENCIEEQMSWYTKPNDLVYSFKNGSFSFTGVLEMLGDNCQLILDEAASGRSSTSLQLSGLHNSQFIIRNGSTFETGSFRWGYQNSTNNVCLVTNATLTITGYMTLGANKGKDTMHSKSNAVVVAKNGILNCPSSTQEFDVGWHSEDDLLLIDGGTMTDGRVTRIGYQDCLNPVFKVRGETASVTFSNALTFDNGATLACELPLPTDRAVMTSTSTVTINSGTKFAVTLPEGFTPGTYTILTANSITGTIADADISVTGKGTCKLVQDGTSIKMTVKPKIGLILIVR